MGYNTVAVIMNDALDMIEKDKDIGEGIHMAARMFASVSAGYRPRTDADIPAISRNGVHCNAISIISQDHANGYQVVIVHGNTGWRLDDPEIPQGAIDMVLWHLRQRGYQVMKPKARQGDKS